MVKPRPDHPWKRKYKAERKDFGRAKSLNEFEPRIVHKANNTYQRIMQVIPDSIKE